MVVVPSAPVVVPVSLGRELPVAPAALTPVVVVVVRPPPGARPAATMSLLPVVPVGKVRSGSRPRQEAGAPDVLAAAVAEQTTLAARVVVVRAAAATVVQRRMVRMVVQTSAVVVVVRAARSATSGVAALVVQAPSLSNMKPHF